MTPGTPLYLLPALRPPFAGVRRGALPWSTVWTRLALPFRALARLAAAISTRRARRAAQRRRMMIRTDLGRDLGVTEAEIGELFSRPVLARDDW